MAREIQFIVDRADRSEIDPTVKEVVWSPKGNPAQQALLQCQVFEIFFGGARGGGKTDGMLGEWIRHADRYGKDANGLMIRRTRAELVDTIERSRVLYAPFGWKFNETEKMWRTTNGARLRFAYLERDADAALYTGHSYTRLYVEEIGNFPNPAPIMKLMATLRSAAKVPVGLRATGNPGGPGHHWVRQRYIDPAPLGNKIIKDPITDLERVFIPSKVDNNSHIDIEAYKQRLRASGSKELVKAWLDGDWSVTMGAFFDCWDTKKHVIEPFEVPKEWMKFRAMDWGSAVPFCVLWFAVLQDNYEVSRETEGDKMMLPRGCLVCYREYYGMQPGQPNVGVKLTADFVGQGIKGKEKNETISYGVLDPSAFAQDGGPSIAEMMVRGSDNTVFFRHADNTRVAQRGAIGGWDQMRSRLVGDAEGRPMLVFFSTCVNCIRTIPFLQHDQDRPEDLMTDSEDHCFTGDTLVSTTKGVYPIAELVGSEGETWSSDNCIHHYRSARKTRMNAPIVVLQFSDGSEIKCTPDHKFLTTRGWLQARSLSSCCLIRCKNFAEFDFTNVGFISNAKVFDCIGLCGRSVLVQFRKIITSITRTVIETIISPIILPVFQARNICPCTVMNARTNPEYFWIESVHEQPRGTVVPLGVHGIADIISTLRTSCTPKSRSNANIVESRLQSDGADYFARMRANRHGVAWLGLTTKFANALSAAMNSMSINMLKSKLARRHVEPLQVHARELVCHSVKDAGRADVYCLTVPDTGNFVLANGAIVSNCADAVRYACMSRPYVPTIEPEPKEKTSGYRPLYPQTQAGDWKQY